MPLRSETSSSRDTLNTVTTVTTTGDRRRTGRYVAVGAVLAITLLAVHQTLLRETFPVTGICIPAIIMVSYILWILYSAHRDRRRALRFATAMQLTEVINVPNGTGEMICRNGNSKEEKRKSDTAKSKLAYTARESRENPAFSSKDEAV
ncbi:uncharacterized protein LOC108626248 [Ceratina calcarata]|uniref:Uncharacterized protein LOC108626248 n=1 Tax=Ceratina calcarata TaxID=156304 RepID=A0AAJ7S4G5_9HYME|nr:uncharacterized protein LOC108626248 [Ceratina calcarata]